MTLSTSQRPPASKDLPRSRKIGGTNYSERGDDSALGETLIGKNRAISLAPRPSLASRTATQVSVEREVKFVVPQAELPELSKRSTLIEQHYFPKSLPRHLIALFSEVSGVNYSEVGATKFRVRSRIEEGRSSFFLEAKGSPSKQFPHERLEVSTQISEHLYSSLLGLASEGSLQKRRYYSSGQLDSGRLVVAEIDFLMGGRSGSAKDSPYRLPFAIVEIEFSSRVDLKRFQRGKHDLDFVRGKYEVNSGKHPELKKLVSQRRLARGPVTAELVQSVMELCGRQQAFSKARTA